MRYRELGRTGLDVSIVSFGTSPLGDMFGATEEHAALEIVDRALDAGITFFDSSPYYGRGLAEERLGKALRGRRDEIGLGTKAGRYGDDEFDFSPSRIRSSLEESLRRLDTDYVDIFQLHDIEFVRLEDLFGDAYDALLGLRAEGKCRFIGMTGYPTAALRRAIEATELDVVLSYAHNTLLDSCLQRSLLPVAEARGVGVINAAAVALGLLTPAGPRIEHPAGEEIRAAARRMVQTCARLGTDVSFLANQFAIQRSNCATTLIGTVNPEHLDNAVAAAEAPIDEDVLAEVLHAAGPSRDRCWVSGLTENN